MFYRPCGTIFDLSVDILQTCCAGTKTFFIEESDLNPPMPQHSSMLESTRHNKESIITSNNQKRGEMKQLQPFFPLTHTAKTDVGRTVFLPS